MTAAGCVCGGRGNCAACAARVVDEAAHRMTFANGATITFSGPSEGYRGAETTPWDPGDDIPGQPGYEVTCVSAGGAGGAGQRWKPTVVRLDAATGASLLQTMRSAAGPRMPDPEPDYSALGYPETCVIAADPEQLGAAARFFARTVPRLARGLQIRKKQKRTD